ncbi:MAG: hypothetical protein EBX90_08705, partial [Betaproteobacteria bacterium]|nr:hypothetical protein [Betaproteobacteria bacterium]
MIERLLRGEPGVKEWQRSDFTIGASINRGSVAMQSQARTVTVIDRVINHQYQEGSLAGVVAFAEAVADVAVAAVDGDVTRTG